MLLAFLGRESSQRVPSRATDHARFAGSFDTNVMHRSLIAFDPIEYRHVRWLDRNDERQRARKLQFDSSALLGLAVERGPGARKESSTATRYKVVDKSEIDLRLRLDSPQNPSSSPSRPPTLQ